MEGNTVVANPGAIPELVMMAAGLARARLLREFVTPVGVPRGRPASRLWRMAPGVVRVQVARELRRRELPPDLEFGSVHHAATLLEILAVAFQRLPAMEPAHILLATIRDAVFDRSVLRRLKKGDKAFIGSYGAALHSLRRANRLGIASYLEYPIAHHSFADAIQREEAKRVPEYAPTMRFHSARRTALLNDEIQTAHRVFVLSEFQKRTFLEAGIDEEKLIVTPLGVDLDTFKPIRTSREKRVFRVIFVGQISQRKGISYLIEAFRMATIPNSELLLVGRMMGLELGWSHIPGMRYVPHVPRWELPELYASADVFVLPSLVEGFALTALEAMACGLPVIVSTNTFAADVVTDSLDGYVTPIRDPVAIAERLQYLYRHPAQRDQMGKAARRRAEDFSWDRYGELITSIIRSGSSPRQPTSCLQRAAG
jgi:glycosyltransferase involved in cell wall biosynthesis